jgi:hypothetical protein
LELANADNSALARKNKSLRISIRTVKGEVRDRDRLYLEMHMKSEAVTIELVEINKKVCEFQQLIRDTDEKATEYRNKIQRCLYLIGQAGLEITEQKQNVTNLKSGQLALGDSETCKATEVSSIEAKIQEIWRS